MRQNAKEAMTEARQLENLLMYRYKVPAITLKHLRYTYANKAVQDSHEIKMNRLYTLLAIVCKDHLGFGMKRTQDLLNAYSTKYQEFYNSGCDWHALMQECRDKTGIIIRTGEEGDEVCEFSEEGEKESG